MFVVNTGNRAQYYKYLAKLNFQAANAADDKVGFWPGYEIAAPPPVMTLCAHTIELALKAFLLDKGVRESDVQKFGHNLVSCWDECIKHGAPNDLLDRPVLEIISDLLKSNRLRYGEQSNLGKVPVYGPLSELCEACLKLCGAPALEDILHT